MKDHNLPKATHEGTIEIEGIKIRCYNLNSGERVLSREGFLRAIGRKGNPKFKEGKEDLFQTPVFLRAKNLKPFISNDLLVSSNHISFELKGGRKAYGYVANILPGVCYVFTDAKNAGVLTPPQEIYAQRAEILIRGFATLGIIALVDEATGYQYEREQKELQTILKLFVSEEILNWQRTFHLGFYREIFRLWGVPFTDRNIKRKPLFIGKLTSELVYKKLPKGTFILEKLKAKTPKTKSGYYRYRLHQSLTPEVGRESLKKVIYSIETLAAISNSKERFRRLVEDRYGQREIPFAEFWDIVETPEIDNLSDFDKQLKGLLNVPPKKTE